MKKAVIQVNKKVDLSGITYNLENVTLKTLLAKSGISVNIKDKASLRFLEKTVDNFLLENYYVSINSKTLTESFIGNFNEVMVILKDMKLIGITGEFHESGIIKLSHISKYVLLLNSKLDNLYSRESLKYSDKEVLNNAIVYFEEVEGVFENLQSNMQKFESDVCMKLIRKQLTCAKRGIEFNLSFQNMKDLMMSKNCYYSGVALTLEGDHRLTLDRIDATKGYLPDNVVACSSAVNTIKNKMFENCEYFSGNLLSKEEKKKMLKKFIEEI